jgi:hypothetical protein
VPVQPTRNSIKEKNRNKKQMNETKNPKSKNQLKGKTTPNQPLSPSQKKK